VYECNSVEYLNVHNSQLIFHHELLNSIISLLSIHQQKAITNMKTFSALLIAAMASFASAAVGGYCDGNPERKCLCLVDTTCKGIGGTPIESYKNGAGYPCPRDPGNVWGCYIWCD